VNTGKKIETERLLLIPGSNARDDAHFIHMLRNDGDFRDFCGIEFSEKYLAEFKNYLERQDMKSVFIQYFLREQMSLLAM